jgi:transcription initiation factor TFIIB
MNKLECVVCKTNTGLVSDLESAELICSKCGTVIGRVNSDFDSVGKFPSALSMDRMGISTQVGKSSRDSGGQLLDTNIKNTMKRLRTWDSRIQVRDPSLRNYRMAYALLNKLKGKLNLPYSVIEDAAHVYRRAQREGMVRGKTIASAIAASLYMACREANISRTVGEIAQAANVKRNAVTREYRSIAFKLDRKIPHVDYCLCIEKIGGRIGVPEKILRQAMSAMEKIEHRGLCYGKNPMGMAGAVLYNCMCLSGVKIKQRDIAAASETTEVTLRNSAKGLKRYEYLYLG